ncbi:MAG: hypothetical protein HYX71_08860 [Opitutae bacterium]|nr:hypothetical protein [Opitutae bacterium]
MHAALIHPLIPAEILRNRRAIRRELLQRPPQKNVRIAILGGSTTHEIKANQELFLLDGGIAPAFYESDYNRFHEELMFAEPKLLASNPEIIYFHVTWRNLSSLPPPFAPESEGKAFFD